MNSLVVFCCCHLLRDVTGKTATYVSWAIAKLVPIGLFVLCFYNFAEFVFDFWRHLQSFFSNNRTFRILIPNASSSASLSAPLSPPHGNIFANRKGLQEMFKTNCYLC